LRRGLGSEMKVMRVSSGMPSGHLCDPRCLLRSMNDGDNVQLVRFDVVDDSVGAFQNFSYLREIDFWDDAARLWERGDLLGASGEAINDSQSVLR
jgi:hypothetical protein